MVAAYIYGAPIHDTRFLLLLSEAALDVLKRGGTSRSFYRSVFAQQQLSSSRVVCVRAFVAFEPGTNCPPQFERAAAALQKHQGGPSLKVRGASGLKLSSVRIHYARSENPSYCLIYEEAKGSSAPLGRVPFWHLLQSWRTGSFGEFKIPAEALGRMGSIAVEEPTEGEAA